MTQCEFIILGCGGSGGVPLVTGYWGNCDPSNPKNRRMRSSIAIRTARTCVVIDTGPDFHEQTLRHNISNIDAVMYTHEHADHINGIDDVRYLAIKKRINGHKDYKFPIYGSFNTLESIQNRFDYLFHTDPQGLYIPLIDTHIIEPYKNMIIGDIAIKPVPQMHGAGESMGFIAGDIAYSTDVSELSDEALKALNGIRVWVVDCGQFGSDQTTVHANFEKVLQWNDTVQAEKLVFTHLKASDDYNEMMNGTPDFIEPAYDGMILTTLI